MEDYSAYKAQLEALIASVEQYKSSDEMTEADWQETYLGVVDIMRNTQLGWMLDEIEIDETAPGYERIMTILQTIKKMTDEAIMMRTEIRRMLGVDFSFDYEITEDDDIDEGEYLDEDDYARYSPETYNEESEE